MKCVLVFVEMQAGVDLVADLLGVTLGPKGRNVVLGNKYGPPKIVNDGETVLKEVNKITVNDFYIHYVFSLKKVGKFYHLLYILMHNQPVCLIIGIECVSLIG